MWAQVNILQKKNIKYFNMPILGTFYEETILKKMIICPKCQNSYVLKLNKKIKIDISGG